MKMSLKLNPFEKWAKNIQQASLFQSQFMSCCICGVPRVFLSEIVCLFTKHSLCFFDRRIKKVDEKLKDEENKKFGKGDENIWSFIFWRASLKVTANRIDFIFSAKAFIKLPQVVCFTFRNSKLFSSHSSITTRTVSVWFVSIVCSSFWLENTK